MDEAHQELRDPRAMRALAHPVRLALMDALSLDGELTATQAPRIVGESPANCFFHFRQLAKYAFVEEAGGGAGRQRPWRLKTLSITLSAEDAAESYQAKRAIWWVTPQELERLGDEMQALVLRHSERVEDPSSRSAGALPSSSWALPTRCAGAEATGGSAEVTPRPDNHRTG